MVITTFLLVTWGGVVTTKDVGLAIPDAPNTNGHNMFFAPYSVWSAPGAFIEHTHRLLGSFVGMLAIVLCWMLIATQKRRMWLSGFGVALLAAIIFQGLMGIWRVTQINEYWGIAHGVTGQLVLCMTVLVAAATSQWWLGQPATNDDRTRTTVDANALRRARRLGTALFFVILVQLTLGATIRHTGAGLAIPDFPTNYGGLVPPFTQAGIDAAIAEQVPYDHPIAETGATYTQIQHHFSHRVWAIVVVGVFLWCMTAVARVARDEKRIMRPGLIIMALLVVQIALGASVIWLERQEHVTSSHQAIGAIILAMSFLMMARLYRMSHGLKVVGGQKISSATQPSTSDAALPAAMQGVGA